MRATTEGKSSWKFHIFGLGVGTWPTHFNPQKRRLRQTAPASNFVTQAGWGLRLDGRLAAVAVLSLTIAIRSVAAGIAARGKSRHVALSIGRISS